MISIKQYINTPTTLANPQPLTSIPSLPAAFCCSNLRRSVGALCLFLHILCILSCRSFNYLSIDVHFSVLG